MLVSNDLLRVFLAHNASFWSSRHVEKNPSSQFFDLDIENLVGRATLAKFEPSLYRLSEAGNVKCCSELHARSGLSFII